MLEVLRFLWARPSFRHMSLATALHSVVWYAGGAFNNAFLQRSHQMTAQQAGYWISMFAAVGAVGTFLGGFAADRLSTRAQRSPLVPVGPGNRHAPLGAVSVLRLPVAESVGRAAVVCRDDGDGGGVLRAVVRDDAGARRAAHAVGGDVGAALRPDVDRPGRRSFGRRLHQRPVGSVVPALRRCGYALVIVGLVNVWAAAHYLWGARTLRADLERTERLAARA